MTKHLLVTALFALTLSYGTGPHSTRGQDLAGSSKEPSSDNAEVLAEASRLNESMIELFKVAKYDEALLVGKRVLELQQRARGPQHLLIAKTLKNIGEIYLAKKKHDEAEKLFRQALTIFEREPGQNETVSYLLETLGVIQFNKRQYHRAALLLEKALAIREKGSGKTDVALAETLHALANVYQVQRRFEEAEPLYLRALSIKEKTLGRSDSGTVAAMKDYACLNLRDSKVTVVKPGTKGEDLDSDDQVGNERKALKSRAFCWLGGLTATCADDSPGAFLKPKGLLNGTALSLPKPKYPQEARQRVGGRVFVAVLIDQSGKVARAKAVCGGTDVLIDASLKSALAARFTPTILNNKPIQVTGVIVYNFVIQ